MTTVLAPAELLDDETCSLEPIELTAAIQVESVDETTDPAEIPAKILLEGIDPTELIFTRNVRKAELTPEFVDSIAEHGLFQPIIATPYEAGIAIILGNRRAKGSIEAGRTIDVIVRNDLNAEEARIIAQLIENMHREDMRESEIADAYAQLSIELGLDADQIAARVAQDPKKVRASIALSAMPKTARSAVDEGALTLEDAELIAEFESDPKAYKRLLDTIERGGKLSWAIKNERAKAEKAMQRKETTQALKASGVRMVGEPYGFGWNGSKEVGLGDLADADGVVLTPESHKSCGGHAAFFNERVHGDLKATFLCRDPHQYEHNVLRSYSFRSPAEEVARAAAEQADRERKEALTIAAEVRHEYIQELCRSKKVPKGMTRKVLAMLYKLGADHTDPEVLKFLQAPGDDDRTARYGRFIGRTAEARLPLVLLATVAVRAEREVRQAASGWGDKQDVVTWFEFLKAYGYELNEPEVELLAELRTKIAAAEARAATKAEEEAAGEAAADAEEDEEGPGLAAQDEELEDEELEGEEDEEGPGLAAQDEEQEDALDRYLTLVTDDESDGPVTDRAGEQAEEGDWEARYPEINEPIAA
ncbi:ParB/RepB/Spo0J family partition protein [Kitasatospora sp. NPDC059088]|uniref:ParB/RepB/Spo0J family partition protein n=1 Tax=Kitasatospora sp. NPDC059088 TaxID=3346722 RepID=UPI0036935BA5